jgi:hypothetical protein
MYRLFEGTTGPGALRSHFVFPGDEMMKAHLKYRPDLRACVLEDRFVPVIPSELGDFLLPVVPNVAPIVLTPAGYVLMSSFPGSAIPVSFVVTGSGGISSMQPGKGNSNGGATSTIFVGSGANDVVATIIPLVTRNTIANDALNAAPLIGGVLGDRSDVLPAEQVYRGGLPVSASGGVSTEASGQRSGPNPDERPVDPLPIRLRSRPHGLASGASGSPVRSPADRAP